MEMKGEREKKLRSAAEERSSSKVSQPSFSMFQKPSCLCLKLAAGKISRFLVSSGLFISRGIFT